MEHECIFISSRGLLKSCNIHNKSIGSSDTHLEDDIYSNIKENDIVYVNNSAVKDFFENYFNKIHCRFILVSGDSDVSMPFEGYEAYVNQNKLLHWFSQNLTLTHPKLSHIPIGLDYHTISQENFIHPWGMGCKPLAQEQMLQSIVKKSLTDRLFACYVNFHFNEWDMNKRGDRQECLSQIDKSLCYFQPQYIDRMNTWNQMSQFVFVLCPFGGGYDTHRLWEALALGCIPIIKTSGLDPLFEDLNVFIVKSWTDVNPTNLIQYIANRKESNDEKLTLQYWVKKIKSKQTMKETDSVVRSIVNKFLSRAEVGQKKYGTNLDRTDLSTLDWIQHAQEELMDGILYLEKLKQQIR